MTQVFRGQGFYARDVRVLVEPDGKTFAAIAKKDSGEEFAIALNTMLTLKLVWEILQTARTAAVPLNLTGSTMQRGSIDLVDDVPADEMGFALSHDHSRVVLAIRFGSLTLPVGLHPSVVSQVKERIAEVEVALASAPSARQ